MRESGEGGECLVIKALYRSSMNSGPICNTILVLWYIRDGGETYLGPAHEFPEPKMTSPVHVQGWPLLAHLRYTGTVGEDVRRQHAAVMVGSAHHTTKIPLCIVHLYVL